MGNNISDYINYYVSHIFDDGYIKEINEINCHKFPNNFFMPKKLDTGEILHVVRFSGLNDLYEYLTSDPVINEKVFKYMQSLNNDSSFAGKSYDDAVSDLISNSYNPGYQEFLKLQNSLENCINMPIHRYNKVMTVAGGHLNVPAYSAGAPLCYETEERRMAPKFIHIDVTISYMHSTTKEQVFNRAIIVIGLI